MGAIHQALLAAGPSGGGSAPSALTVNFMAGAEHESSAVLKWPLSGGVVFASSIADMVGRVYDNAGAGDLNIVALGANYQHITVGFRVRLRALGNGTTFASMRDSGTVTGMLGPTTSGALRVGRNGTQQIQITGAGYLSINTSYLFMWRYKIADSGGEWEVRVMPIGGSADTPLSGTGDTRSDATSGEFANQFLLGDAASDTYVDEAWVEVTGAAVGFCRVETLAPTGAGGLTQLTRGGADSGANWSQVDDHPANGDTDYVVSTGVNQSDSYALANRSVTGTPLAVQMCVEGKFASAGTRQFKLGLRIAGTVYEGTITHTLTSAYAVYREVWNNNPATSNAWTDGAIDGMEPVIVCLTTDCRITNVAIEVLVQI